MIESGAANALYALATRELQFNGPFDYSANDAGKLYTFIVPADTCAIR